MLPEVVSKAGGNMFRKLKAFERNERGNIGIMAGLVAAPLFLLAAGAIDMSLSSGARQKMQSAADAAVMAALARDNMSPRDRMKLARRVFQVNLANVKGLVDLKSNIRGQRISGGFYVSFSGSARLESLFGGAESSFAKDIQVVSTAEVSKRTGGRPRLVRSKSVKSRQGR